MNYLYSDHLRADINFAIFLLLIIAAENTIFLLFLIYILFF